MHRRKMFSRLGHSVKQLTVNRYDAHPNEYASQIAAGQINQFLSFRSQ